MTLRQRLIVALIAGLCHTAALADTAAAPGAALRALQNSLVAQLAARPDDPGLNYQLGVVAYKLGDYPTAQAQFERVLTLQPNHAGAMLDLALTLYARSEYDAAETLFDRLSALPDLPAAAGATIADYRARLAARKPQWRSAGSLGVALGSSSNANQGLNNGTVDLPVLGNLELAPSYVARSDRFAELTLDGRSERSWGERCVYLLGSLRERRWASEHAFNQRWLLGGIGVVTPLAPQLSWDSSVLLVEGWLGDSALEGAGYWFNQLTLNRGLWAHWLRLEAGEQHFPDDSRYDARQLRLVLGSGYARPEWKIAAEAGAVFDQATNGRPGGDRQGYEWLLSGAVRLQPGWWLNGQWQGENDKQQSPFATEVFGPLKRMDRSQALSLSLAWQPSQAYRWEFSASHSEVGSNLDLYSLKRNELRLELRRQWD